ncbi:MAG: type I glutamate--ammonia ligase [Gemmatimonadetes bacterium]|nr:type I glutamate--ammonia ligase [Gemmatimonadota bacterium]
MATTEVEVRSGARGAAARAKPVTGPQEVVRLVKEQGIEIVDVKFTDVLGTWQHFSLPAEELGEECFAEGLGFDGSSIRGFQDIHESDMLLVPAADTAFVDPICEVKTLSLICDVRDPVTGQPYTRDPRYIARKAEAYLPKTGIATDSYWGPEAEFYIFNSIRFDQGAHFGFYEVDSEEGIWNSGKNTASNLANRPRHKEGYFPVPPVDRLQDLRSRIVLKLREAGVPVEVHHHEVGTAGQAEIDMRFSPLVRMADQVQIYKYVVRNVCHQHGYVATFMPKPLFGDNGSGMHVHQSLWKQGSNLFFEAGKYGDISDLARWYMGGLIAHSPALLAFCAPTTNSYRRLVPGYEAPINLIYSQRNRSACCRIPVYSRSPKTKRVEYRPPDPAANPYLAFAAMLMAGLDGIRRQIEPPAPIDKDLYHLSEEERSKVKNTPGSLGEVLMALELDHDFLLEGGVFTPDLIESWIAYKRTREVEPMQLRPHPYEFFLYHDV